MRKILEQKFVWIIAGLWLLSVFILVTSMQFINGGQSDFSTFVIAWDGNWYNSIVQHGYQPGVIATQANVAFFPLYPGIVWLVSHVMSTPLAAFIISSSCFIAALFLLYNFVAERYSPRVACWAVLFTAFSPWSFYFGMMYTESLFLLLGVSVFYLLYKKQFWWAAVIAGLATATRFPGIILAMLVIVSWIIANKSQLKQWQFYLKTLLFGLVSVSGLLLFITFLARNNGDPLAFIHVQQFWPGREGAGLFREMIILLKHLTPGQLNLQYLITGMWYVATVAAIVGVIALLHRKEYLFASFLAMSILLPLMTGSATSMSRYIIVLFPLYILIGLWIHHQPRPIKIPVLAFSLAGLITMIYLITRIDMPFVG